MIKASCIYMPNCILAEGCVWNEGEKRLYFIDIEAGELYSLNPALAPSLNPASNQERRPDKADKPSPVRIFPQEDKTGCMVFHRDGGVVAAVKNRLVYQNLSDKTQRILIRQDFPDIIRYNDGKCDRYGNLWVGTMAVSQDLPGAKGCGSLCCIRENRVVAEYPGYTIPNGMDWNEDGSMFYHIDTALQRIDAYEVEDQIYLKNRHPILCVPERDGSPDGMCMDENGNFWVAMWGGGKVICYDAVTGKKLEEVVVPDKYVSCCCFGGENGRSLFITTARGEDGTGGQIYRAEAGVRGAKRYRYGNAAYEADKEEN